MPEIQREVLYAMQPEIIPADASAAETHKKIQLQGMYSICDGKICLTPIVALNVEDAVLPVRPILRESCLAPAL